MMIFEVRFSDESVASALVEAPSAEEAKFAFSGLDPAELRRMWLERTDAGNFVIESVEEADWAAGDIDAGALLAAFDRWHARINDARDEGSEVPGADEAFSAGETLISLRHPAVALLNAARGDFLDSSAEVAALALALEELGII